MSCRTTVSRLLRFAFVLLIAAAAQAQLDPCDGVDCNHGSCLSTGEGSYMCQCADGYTGDDCSTVADFCAMEPCVNGDCANGENNYICSCYPGWAGDTCEIDIDECASSPCVHGVCNDVVNQYVCVCDAGWTGTNCDAEIATLDCSDAVASSGLLWPPTHELVPISVLDVTDPNGGTVTITFTGVFQDEPVSGLGDGDASPDATGVGTTNVSVRSERDGKGDGRVYHISFNATSSSGESCTGAVTVGVPKSQGQNGGPVDGGALHDSTQP
jgi:hypothetical protein